MKQIQLLALVITIVIVVSSVAVYALYFAQPQNGMPQGGVTIIDSEGYSTTISSTPQRIISISPSVTPILYELGVGDKIVGLTDYDNYPYDFSAWFAAGNMTSVGGFSTPDMEIITSLQPDLIFTTNINDPLLPNMRELGFNVIVVGPTSIQGIYDTINMIGKATGAEDKAVALVSNLQTEISNIQSTIAHAAITDKPTVYYEVWYDSTGMMSAGSTSWINDVITTAGGVNIFEDMSQEYPSTSSEVIISRNPDVILLPTNMGMGTPFYGSVQEVKDRPGWNTIDAVKNNRIYVINQDIFNQPNSRVAEQVKAVAQCLYPDLFSSTP
jgi:iron complex transport system substrate-binding protein